MDGDRRTETDELETTGWSRLTTSRTEKSRPVGWKADPTTTGSTPSVDYDEVDYDEVDYDDDYYDEVEDDGRPAAARGKGVAAASSAR